MQNKCHKLSPTQDSELKLEADLNEAEGADRLSHGTVSMLSFSLSLGRMSLKKKKDCIELA